MTSRSYIHYIHMKHHYINKHHSNSINCRPLSVVTITHSPIPVHSPSTHLCTPTHSSTCRTWTHKYTHSHIHSLAHSLTHSLTNIHTTIYTIESSTTLSAPASGDNVKQHSLYTKELMSVDLKTAAVSSSGQISLASWRH